MTACHSWFELSMTRFTVVIPAGGTGSRFGASLPKQFTRLGGIPVLHRTIALFTQSPRIHRVVVALPTPVAELPIDWPFAPPQVIPLTCAGATRARTVLNALDALSLELAHDAWILVHDAARPCLTQPGLDRLLDTLMQDPTGGLMAIPVTDTVKRQTEDLRVAETVPRAGLWAAQTPQMFRLGPLRAALTAYPDATDESSAMESMGHIPKLVLGENSNLKITYPTDLVLAETWLETLNHAHRPRI